MIRRAALMILGSAWLLFGCALLDAPAIALTPLPPTGAPPTVAPPASSTAAPTLSPDTGWQPLQPGLERRQIQLPGGDGLPWENVYILRLEPDYFEFGVAYRPGQPLALSQWLEETGALLVVNGGYFTEEHIATGRIVSRGEASGVSYGDFAGMFAVTDNGPELRWLRERPYNPQETLWAGLQSFPLLVKPGGELGFPDEDGRPSRRVVIAQDKQGRFLFIVTRGGGFTLHQLSRYLVAGDLGLEIALNLDGGASAGLMLREPAESVPPFVLLPAVITVHTK
jgi:uncharacterized protein YigE (DUF2233 family)